MELPRALRRASKRVQATGDIAIYVDSGSPRSHLVDGWIPAVYLDNEKLKLWTGMEVRAKTFSSICGRRCLRIRREGSKGLEYVLSNQLDFDSHSWLAYIEFPWKPDLPFLPKRGRFRIRIWTREGVLFQVIEDNITK